MARVDACEGSAAKAFGCLGGYIATALLPTPICAAATVPLFVGEPERCSTCGSGSASRSGRTPSRRE
jgi:hypothetical protein